MNKDFYFNFSVSTRTYDRNTDNAAFLQWKETNGTITTLSQSIYEGYAYCNCFYHEEGTTFGNGFKKDENVKSANLICLDLDAVKYPYDDFVTLMEQTEIMPNIVYTTANNGKLKKDTETYNNRYRVIYVIDEPIYNNALYKDLHQAIKNEIRIITEDDNVFNDNTDSCVSHFFAGCKGTNITTDENIYTLSWLMQRYCISTDNGNITRNNNKEDESANHFNNKGENTTPQSATRNNNKDITKYQADVYIGDENKTDMEDNMKYHADVYIKKGRRVLYNRLIFQNEEFKNDILTLPIDEIIIKYQDIYNTDEHTKIEFADDELYKYLPTDYLEIRRKWNFENVNFNGRQINVSKALKIKNGEGRRKTIFLNLILRKRINPNITIEHLLYNGLRELYYFIDNTDKDDVITTYEISRIAYEVFITDINKWKFTANTKKFKINKEYCKKNGINARRAALQVNRNNISKEKHNKIEQIKVLYNSELSDQENINIFVENGIKISMATFRRYKKEMGLSKTYNRRPTSAQKQKDNKVIATENINAQSAKETPNKSVINDQKQKVNEVIDQQIISAERAQETPQKEVTIKAQETANKSVLSVSNVKGEQIPNEEETSAERAQETPISYNNKYPHLVWINEMIHFENGMENANTIQELEQMKNDFEMKLKGFPQIPQTAEKVVNNSLKSTMIKYEKILESLKNKA